MCTTTPRRATGRFISMATGYERKFDVLFFGDNGDGVQAVVDDIFGVHNTPWEYNLTETTREALDKKGYRPCVINVQMDDFGNLHPVDLLVYSHAVGGIL